MKIINKAFNYNTLQFVQFYSHMYTIKQVGSKLHLHISHTEPKLIKPKLKLIIQFITL